MEQRLFFRWVAFFCPTATRKNLGIDKKNLINQIFQVFIDWYDLCSWGLAKQNTKPLLKQVFSDKGKAGVIR